MTRIHIFGASGSGTTTLGEALAKTLDIQHYDTDSYFWMPTDPPFQVVRERTDRLARMLHDLENSESWVLSGALCGWGDLLIPMFDLVVFLWIPSDLRMQRLRKREFERYGLDIDDPSDPRYEKHEEFLNWAAGYDSGPTSMRSRARHEAWMSALPCRVIRLAGDRTVQENMNSVLAQLADRSFHLFEEGE